MRCFHRATNTSNWNIFDALRWLQKFSEGVGHASRSTIVNFDGYSICVKFCGTLFGFLFRCTGTVGGAVVVDVKISVGAVVNIKENGGTVIGGVIIIKIVVVVRIITRYGGISLVG